MTGFNDVFGGGVVQPADVSYRAVALTADVTLVWPTLSETSSDTMARILGVTPTGAYAMTFPDARQVSPGQDVLVRNLGASTITIKDAGGNTITTVATGVSKYIYLVDNSTANGSWSSVTFGTGTSSADAASLVGYGIKAIGITLNQKHDVTELAANRTILDSDRAAMYSFTTGSWTMSLPAAANVGDDFFFIAKNAGDGSITVTPAGADTIDGAVSLTMAPGDACIFFSAGGSDAWYTVGLGRSVSFAFTQLSKSVAGGTDVTLTSSEAANKVMSFTGLLTANINVIVPSTVSVYYVSNDTTGAFTLTVKTAAGTGVTVAQGTRDILVCDATNVYSAKSNTVSVQYFANGSESLPSISFITDTDTGWYRSGANQPAVTAGGTDVMRWNTVASAVNAIDVFPAATGSAPYFKPYGGDANVNLEFRPLGEAGMVFTGGTVTTDNPVIKATQTWNAGGVAFTGWRLNVTDSASSAASLLLDLQVGGSSKISATKAGALTTASTLTVTSGGLTVSAGTTSLQATTIGAALTYGGTTLTYGVTGTGSMVLSAGPTFTGTLTAAAINASGNITATGATHVFGSNATTAGLIVGATSFSSNNDAYLQLSNSSTQRNWRIGANVLSAGVLDFIPSTAGGGTTFTTSVLSLSNTGVAVTGALSATGTAVVGGSSITVSGAILQSRGTITKATTADEVVGFFGSSDASSPLGLRVTSNNNATAGSRQVFLEAAEPGIAIRTLALNNASWTIDSSGNTNIPGTTSLQATTIGAALTYGGTTLTYGVTGTGSMVLSASPTLTGTLTAAAITASGVVTAQTGTNGLAVGNPSGASYRANMQFLGTNASSVSRIAYIGINHTSATDGSLEIYTGGSTSIRFGSGDGEQVRFNSTASATRYITLTGSNGGNPTIGTSAGSLAFSSILTSSSGALSITSANTTIDLFGGVGFMQASGSTLLFGNQGANPLAFYISGAENGRFTGGGYFKASNSGSYNNSTGTYHELVNNSNGNYLSIFSHTHATNPFGVPINFTADPNGTSNQFLLCLGNGTTRAEIRSNGGLANFSANNVNLSDLREKKDFLIYAENADFKARLWAFGKDMREAWGQFRYNDQTHEDPNHGYGAQYVQTVATRHGFSELVDESNWGTKDEPKMRLNVYGNDLMHIVGFNVTEAQHKIDELLAWKAKAEFALAQNGITIH